MKLNLQWDGCTHLPKRTCILICRAATPVACISSTPRHISTICVIVFCCWVRSRNHCFRNYLRRFPTIPQFLMVNMMVTSCYIPGQIHQDSTFTRHPHMCGLASIAVQRHVEGRFLVGNSQLLETPCGLCWIVWGIYGDFHGNVRKTTVGFNLAEWQQYMIGVS